MTEQTTKFECAARRQGTAGGNDPVDCDWPDCGCDEVHPVNPQATRDALTDREQRAIEEIERLRQRVARLEGYSDGLAERLRQVQRAAGCDHE